MESHNSTYTPYTPAIKSDVSTNSYISYPYISTTSFRSNGNANNTLENVIPENLSVNSTLNDAIESIKKSIEDEKDDEIFYEILLSQAPNEDDREILKSIIEDERKHNLLLKQLYKDLTSKNAPSATMSRATTSSTEYLKNLEKALFGELEAVKKYRKIMSAMTDDKKYETMMEIMTDELRHAHKYNFLIAKNMSLK